MVKKALLIFLIFLSHICTYGQNVVVMSQNSGIGMQTYFYSGAGNSLQTEEIKKYWNEDYYINAVSYTSLGWFVAMSKGCGFTNQSYKQTSDWPDEWIHEKAKSGYLITTLHYSGSNWMVVASKGSSYTKQEIGSAPWDGMKDWIKKWWNEDYYITDIAVKDGLWTVVMSKTNLYSNQSYLWASSQSELEEKVKKKWEEGYRITALQCSGNNNWLCVMSVYVNSSSRGQTYRYGTSEIADFIKKNWDDNYRITYIGG